MALLSTHELTAFYGDFQALFGIDTHVDEGETIAIIGSNGAGKSTYLRSITGLIRVRGESIRFDGRPIGGLPVTAIAKLGISLIPEGRRLFPSLSVQENLLIGRYGCDAPGTWSLDAIFALFPILAERRRAPSAALSGGQQQMVAIGRALISNPRLLLCDEISLGLAPVVINDIYNTLPKIKASGITVVLVEQDIVRALAAADRVYCFQEGRLSLTGRPSALTRQQIHAAYFGT
jgi:branched-chain amino acid transport system ATP-binding protein